MKKICQSLAVCCLLLTAARAEESLAEQKVKLLTALATMSTQFVELGRFPPGEVAALHSRLNKATLELAATPEARLAAAQENLKRIEKLHKVVNELLVSLRALKISVDQVEVVLIEAQQQVAQEKKDAAGERAFCEAKIKLLESIASSVRELFDTGHLSRIDRSTSPTYEVIVWQRRVCDARIELAVTQEARAELAKKHLESVAKLCAACKELATQGRGTQYEASQAEFARIEALQRVAKLANDAAGEREQSKAKVKFAEQQMKESEQYFANGRMPPSEHAARIKRFFETAIEAAEPDARLALAEEYLKSVRSIMKELETLQAVARITQFEVDLFNLEFIEAQQQVERLKKK